MIICDNCEQKADIKRIIVSMTIGGCCRKVLEKDFCDSCITKMDNDIRYWMKYDSSIARDIREGNQ